MAKVSVEAGSGAVRNYEALFVHVDKKTLYVCGGPDLSDVKAIYAPGQWNNVEVTEPVDSNSAEV